MMRVWKAITNLVLSVPQVLFKAVSSRKESLDRSMLLDKLSEVNRLSMIKFVIQDFFDTDQ